MSRLAGRLLKVTALAHAVVGLVLFRQPLAAIAGAGVVNAIGVATDRQAAFWFLLFTPVCYALGQIVERGNGRVLAVVGWNLLLIGAIGAAMMPASGFWIVIAIAPLVLRAAGRDAAIAV